MKQGPLRSQCRPGWCSGVECCGRHVSYWPTVLPEWWATTLALAA